MATNLTLTEAKLKRFVKTRNKSGYSSNLQFQIDANTCGFNVSDLGEVEVHEHRAMKVYVWATKWGLLTECGKLTLHDSNDLDQAVRRAVVAAFHV